MSGYSHSEVRVHLQNCQLAEGLRQTQISSSSTAAQVRTAEATYFRTCLASARANSVSTSPFVTALYELGFGGQ
jgi:hypothetical protein